MMIINLNDSSKFSLDFTDFLSYNNLIIIECEVSIMPVSYKKLWKLRYEENRFT